MEHRQMTGSNRNKRTPAPRHLSKSSKALWSRLVAEFELDTHHLELLRLALEALDRCEDARKALALNGSTYMDRFDAPRARPEVAIERDSRLAAARLFRELGLDAALAEAPRP